MSSLHLSKGLGIDTPRAHLCRQHYFRKYRGVRDYLDGVLESARKDGYVTTLMNRRRYLPEITANNGAVRKFAERTAIKSPHSGYGRRPYKNGHAGYGPGP